MSSALHTERLGTTLVLTLSGQATGNSLSDQVFAAGIEALSVAESDPSVRAIVLQGDGTHFCSGCDLDALRENRDEPHDLAESLARFQDFIDALRVSPKPVIAAVEGAAAGGGVSLALACDLIVAARDARFVMAHAQLGLPPDGGLTWQLLQRVPRAVVLQWLWLGEDVPADRLEALGLINWIAPRGEALRQALEVAARLADCAAHVVAQVKEQANLTPGDAVEQRHLERDHLLASLAHPDGAEGLAARAARRPPRFS